ncbi:hypothetical protein Wenmar_01703 [Wenxinia marina DSM 24838]|uniref:Tetratricopeptide repeat-like domain-containing protein n=2 Tax=Wenxinia TaxID=653686 RepID=A0A0D0PD15_9RHOB|nr:hypothetical protein Wenmar_01703 [Wenxinia marina DSM 24838]
MAANDARYKEGRTGGGDDMTNQNDSFIDEVTEEVRRDRLYFYLRRYGWIAVLVVLVLVGGAAWTEWQASRERAAAEALGDEILAALQANESADRALALDGVQADGGARAVAVMLQAAEAQQAGETEAAVAALQSVASDGDVPALYRDLAALKALMAGADIIPAEERRAGLEALAAPGSAFALLAAEQLALLDLAEGDTDAALARLQAIAEDAAAGQGLRERVQGLIVALGGEIAPEDAADAASPEGEAAAPAE